MDEVTKVIDHLRCMAVIMRTSAEEIDTLLDKEDLTLGDLHEGIRKTGESLTQAMEIIITQFRKRTNQDDD